MNEAREASRVGVQLIVTAFAKQARLHGNPRALARAVVYSRVRHYIKLNLHRPDLNAASLLKELRLPRLPIYRMFEHEGGVDSYIRICRLREAVNDLIRFPTLPVKDVAYGLGFNHVESFNRAFRRTYDFSPQELRTTVTNRMFDKSAPRSMPPVAQSAAGGQDSSQ